MFTYWELELWVRRKHATAHNAVERQNDCDNTEQHRCVFSADR